MCSCSDIIVNNVKLHQNKLSRKHRVTSGGNVNTWIKVIQLFRFFLIHDQKILQNDGSPTPLHLPHYICWFMSLKLWDLFQTLLYRWLSVFIAQKLKDIRSHHLNTWYNGWVSISVREMEMFLIRVQEPATVRNCNCTSETQNKEKCHFNRWILSF